MITRDSGGAVSAISPTVLDLNDLLLDHPAASFIFQLGRDLAIVDRAAIPDDTSMVVIETSHGFAVELYRHQPIFGVVTYRIFKVL